MTTRPRTAHGQKTLEARYYIAANVLAQELERIFYPRWLCVGRSEDVAEPGSYFLHAIGQESLIVVRDRQGQVRAFYNVCRHRGTRLCAVPRGHLSGSIQCPYHAWTYALDGSLIGAPHMAEVADFDKGQYGLHAVGVAEWEGFIWLSLTPNESFETSLGPLHGKFGAWRLPQLRRGAQQVYEVAANWKLIFQNYSECYHCPTLHPALNRLTPYRSAWNDLEEGPILGGPMEISAESMTLSGRYCALPFSDLDASHRQLVFYYTILPNLFLSLHPDYVLVHRLEPQSPSQTRVVCDWLFHPDALQAPGFNPQDAVAFWDMTNRQDWQVCELSQLGIQSRAYTPGPYAELESVLAAFDREYLRWLEG